MESGYDETFYDTFHSSVHQSELEIPKLRFISGEVEYQLFWESSFYSKNSPLTHSILDKFVSVVKYCTYDMSKRHNLKNSKFRVKKIRFLKRNLRILMVMK